MAIFTTGPNRGTPGSFAIVGPKVVEIPLQLQAGNHTLTLGGFNNRKATFDEYTQIFFNNVSIRLSEGGPAIQPLESMGIDFGTTSEASTSIR